MEACPTGALVFGDLDDADSEIAKAAAALKTEAYHPEYGIRPLSSTSACPRSFVVGEVVRRDVPGECAEGVKITLEGGGRTVETLSDSYGDFEFEGLEKNTDYRVGIELDGYASMVTRGLHADRRRPGRDHAGAVLDSEQSHPWQRTKDWERPEWKKSSSSVPSERR